MSLFLNPFASVRITFSENALRETEERLFPRSRHRSARIRKKLIKRFGGEYRKEPVIWETPAGFIVHPSFRSALEEATK